MAPALRRWPDREQLHSPISAVHAEGTTGGAGLDSISLASDNQGWWKKDEASSLFHPKDPWVLHARGGTGLDLWFGPGSEVPGAN